MSKQKPPVKAKPFKNIGFHKGPPGLGGISGVISPAPVTGIDRPAAKKAAKKAPPKKAAPKKAAPKKAAKKPVAKKATPAPAGPPGMSGN